MGVPGRAAGDSGPSPRGFDTHYLHLVQAKDRKYYFETQIYTVKNIEGWARVCAYTAHIRGGIGYTVGPKPPT